MNRIIVFSFLLISAVISSCCTAKKAVSPITNPAVSIPGPKAVIYQTKKDYSKFVPVILSDDKKSLVSYPDIIDVFYNGKLAYPTPLHNGYLLDNRGIGKNVAFINLTYDEYSKLAKTPTADQLMDMIIDKDPLTKMYSGKLKASYIDIEQELNAIIDKGDFSNFVKIK